MKLYIYIGIIILCLIGVTIFAVNFNIGQKDSATKVAEETADKKAISWVQENALYELNMRNGNKEYEAYIVSENQKKYNLQQENKYGKKDDQLVEGDYSFYVVDDKSEHAFKQTESMRHMTFNTSQKNKSTFYVNKHTVAAIYQQRSEDVIDTHMYAIRNGKLVLLSDETLNLYVRKIKNIQQNYLQTISKADKGTYEIKTWMLDSETMQLKELDSTEIKDKDVVSDWLQVEEYYYPYKNVQDISNIISKAEQGMLIGSQYPIGTNMDVIKKSNPNYIKEEKQKDTVTVTYPEVTYYYNEKEKQVKAISIPGIRLKTTLQDLEVKFGQPKSYRKNKEITAVYEAGKYELHFVITDSQEIESIQLMKR
ncbi:YjgB family protein [Niallia sp. NCCP-28]|uniref:YjgB family protein n=1 Tax=Niallia sp. NCCP-28 TaxID=2934712 RepID=UPI0020811477|nr:YjgB family protein [Niallia sp. NCCP-28]GKU84425.1 hypothetical protein NCCP28_38210 [Niallia sp. NCCP-28]